jgi:hypothetical protein
LQIVSDSKFIAYVGIPDIHDGTVLRVSVDCTTAEVVLEGYSGCVHTVLFNGVDEVEMNEPEGMLLYSLSEMSATPPLRSFVFTNNDEDDGKSLRILATDFRICCK